MDTIEPSGFYLVEDGFQASKIAILLAAFSICPAGKSSPIDDVSLAAVFSSAGHHVDEPFGGLAVNGAVV